jgi:hypothetical protein
MEASDIRNLQEAYLEVYSSPEEIDEGMTMNDFKVNRRRLKRKEASADSRKRGHEGKTWMNTGETYSSDDAKRKRQNMSDGRRQALYRISVDPDDDSDNDDHYPASKTKNSKKLRKQKAMGEFGEQVDLYDIILSHLLDEGYTNSIEGAEVILENMSEGWMESIMEAFVDPETGEAPSGRPPLENVSYHPRKSVRKKAMRAFAKQMRKEYGGNWKAKTEDPTEDD